MQRERAKESGQVFRLTTRHDGVKGDCLHGGRVVRGRHMADERIGRVFSQHVRQTLFGRDHDGQAVGPGLREKMLDGV